MQTNIGCSGAQHIGLVVSCGQRRSLAWLGSGRSTPRAQTWSRVLAQALAYRLPTHFTQSDGHQTQLWRIRMCSYAGSHGWLSWLLANKSHWESTETDHLWACFVCVHHRTTNDGLAPGIPDLHHNGHVRPRKSRKCSAPVETVERKLRIWT
jgi:hypothetical protein